MARKRVRLKTIGHVLTELGRQYRRADNGELAWQDAAAAARILREMRTTIEGDTFEARISALETLAAGGSAATSDRRPNGHSSSEARL